LSAGTKGNMTSSLQALNDANGFARDAKQALDSGDVRKHTFLNMINRSNFIGVLVGRGSR